MPDAFALLSAYDMSSDGFTEELLRGIKKLIPLPIMKAKRRKQIRKTVGITLGVVAVIVGIIAAILIPKELKDRQMQAENTAKENAYQSAMALFDNADYTAAQEAFAALGNYKDSAHMAERCPVQPEYDAAMQLYYDGKYAEATWAFDALGDYEDAIEQKNKAKISWRKSVATVVYPQGERYDSEGMKYINSLGILSTESTPNMAEPNEHGKIISTSYNEILYEDGTVSSVVGDEKIGEDAIQFISLCRIGDVILKSDGTVTITNPNEFDMMMECDFSEWKNIVMLAYYNYSYLAGQDSVLIGVDVNGNIRSFSFTYDGYPDNYYKKVEKDFKNIKKISVNKAQVMALTNDEKIITYDYDTDDLSIVDGKDVIDVSCGYILKTDGKLYDYGTKRQILTDVVKIFDSGYSSYAITRSGSLYDLSGEQIGYKTCIYDEWLARMG